MPFFDYPCLRSLLECTIFQPDIFFPDPTILFHLSPAMIDKPPFEGTWSPGNSKVNWCSDSSVYLPISIMWIRNVNIFAIHHDESFAFFLTCPARTYHRARKTNSSFPGANANASLDFSSISVPSSPGANAISNLPTNNAVTILSSISPRLRPTHP